jgi:acetolactate synthase-1/2/3 large subunit
MIRLSDYVIRFIADQGVKHVFLVTGGGAMHLNDALSLCKEIEFVCNLHEQASSIAAENYSKATNHLGVALVTTGRAALMLLRDWLARGSIRLRAYLSRAK